jgi:hypothetical protein
MTKNTGGGTVNQRGAFKPNADKASAEFDITGNVAEKGEEPSPGKRERGETTSADTGSPIDLDLAHDRAS